MEHENKQALSLDESDLALLDDAQLDAVNGGLSASNIVFKPFTQGILIDRYSPPLIGGGLLPGGGIPNGIPGFQGF